MPPYWKCFNCGAEYLLKVLENTGIGIVGLNDIYTFREGMALEEDQEKIECGEDVCAVAVWYNFICPACGNKETYTFDT